MKIITAKVTQALSKKIRQVDLDYVKKQENVIKLNTQRGTTYYI